MLGANIGTTLIVQISSFSVAAVAPVLILNGDRRLMVETRKRDDILDHPNTAIKAYVTSIDPGDCRPAYSNFVGARPAIDGTGALRPLVIVAGEHFSGGRVCVTFDADAVGIKRIELINPVIGLDLRHVVALCRKLLSDVRRRKPFFYWDIEAVLVVVVGKCRTCDKQQSGESGKRQSLMHVLISVFWVGRLSQCVHSLARALTHS
ncbi:Na/Pi-cotransporter II-like protein [Hyphomicrobium denitrificans 1NES1]|uniref:Na/Pi-cotransporter II-like protein n=1 Tax=Hyphomicrobium denitrificans 1NES1 TaxID=670307 RepID=N0BD45_9HYPH|nr:Na/Pi-cotransporter II-like protein [Hyphomicrobium denitrificans 1NES1]